MRTARTSCGRMSLKTGAVLLGLLEIVMRSMKLAVFGTLAYIKIGLSSEVIVITTVPSHPVSTYNYSPDDAEIFYTADMMLSVVGIAAAAVCIIKLLSKHFDVVKECLKFQVIFVFLDIFILAALVYFGIEITLQLETLIFSTVKICVGTCYIGVIYKLLTVEKCTMDMDITYWRNVRENDLVNITIEMPWEKEIYI